MEDYTVIQFNLTRFLKKKDCEIIKKLKANFNEENINYNKYLKYLQKNISHFCKTEKKRFSKPGFF